MHGRGAGPALAGLVAVALIAVLGLGGGGCKTTPPSPPTPTAPDTVTITVQLDNSGQYKPKVLATYLKRQVSMVRWFNNTGTDLSFSFKDGMPFEEFFETATIVVPAHCHSGWFMCGDGMEGKGKKDYHYNGTPHLSGPPGDPMVGSDD